MKRNEFLKTLGFGAFALTGGGGMLSSCMNMDGAIAPDVSDGEFVTALRIPETITNMTALAAQDVKDNLFNGQKASMQGYGNSVLGPTIRVMKGTNMNIEFQNKLTEHTNVHWHGLLVPASMDGHPEKMVMPNQGFNFQFNINQQAGASWYHPHVHKMTAKQVMQGLAGLFIVESPEEKALGLPSGNFEIPLIIQDKRFNADGTIQYNPSMSEKMSGYMGETVLVNATNRPFVDVSTRFYRFRILNASSARIYNLMMSNGADFHVIGSDGGILSQSEKVSNLVLSPGERLDVLVDFSTAKVSDQVYLMSEKFSTMGVGQGVQAFKIMRFNVKNQETDTFKIPASLVNVPKTTGSTKTRSFALKMVMKHGNNSSGMHQINGKVYDGNSIEETVALGAVETWEFDNSTGDEPHPMHIHGVQFQVVSRSGGRNVILAHEKGWKDTVLVAPGERVKVISKFEKLGKFVFHCHNLEHGDDGMMLNYEVK